MPQNNELKVHFVNVNHGDATILELPDRDGLARFGVVDFGAKKGVDRGLARDYLQHLVALRTADGTPGDFVIDFACVTHPHNDHYGGLGRFMAVFAPKVTAFWDCGFRTNSIEYNAALANHVIANPNITFVRLGSGSEFEFGAVRISVLAPSVDMRNRFDTFGVGKNDASIVLRIKLRRSYVILAADAEFATWGKLTEEFPRRSTISFVDDALGLAERDDTAEQLGCSLLKMSHHGSKNGTSLEYLVRLDPEHIVFTAGSQAWYQANLANWANKFPHPLSTATIEVLDPNIDDRVTGERGNLIYKFSGGWSPRAISEFDVRPDDPAFPAALAAEWP